MGLCGSTVNITEISNDADDDVDCPEGGWTVATLEQKIIELSDELSKSTRKALSLKRAKKIRAAKKRAANEFETTKTAIVNSSN